MPLIFGNPNADEFSTKPVIKCVNDNEYMIAATVSIGIMRIIVKPFLVWVLENKRD